MSQLKTAGDLRTFLAETLVGVRDGSIDANKANAISKVAAQINQSLSTEVMTRLKLKELGEAAAGEMLIGSAEGVAEIRSTLPEVKATEIVQPKSLEDATANFRRNQQDGDKIWCDQCEMRVTTGQAVGCKAAFCKAKAAA